MQPRRPYLPSQYSCLTSKSPKSELSPKTQTRKKSISNSSKKASTKKQYSKQDSKISLQNTPLHFSRQSPRVKQYQNKRFRSITQSSNLKQKKSISKSNIKNKNTKPSQSKLAKQNQKLKKALKQSKQQKQMLSDKLQFFKSNAKSPERIQYLKLAQLTELVKSLKKTYHQKQTSKLPLQSVHKSRLKSEIQNEDRQKSNIRLQIVIKNIEEELKQIQGHKQMFQNFTNSNK